MQIHVAAGRDDRAAEQASDASGDGSAIGLDPRHQHVPCCRDTGRRDVPGRKSFGICDL